MNNLLLVMTMATATLPTTNCTQTNTANENIIARNTDTSNNTSTATDKYAQLREWQAGSTVSLNTIKEYGVSKCFSQHNIDDKLFLRIKNKSYKNNCTVSRSDLRYLHLLHYTEDGKIKLGEMICHKDIANALIDIFRELFNNHYPIERMQLIDDFDADDIKSMEHNNTTCFNFRVVAGSKKLSNHSMGKAVDINPLYNPYVKRRSNGTYKISPETGKAYTDRTKKFKYKIDHNDLAYKLFTKHGFRWGGNYRSLKDYQHFEIN